MLCEPSLHTSSLCPEIRDLLVMGSLSASRASPIELSVHVGCLELSSVVLGILPEFVCIASDQGSS